MKKKILSVGLIFILMVITLAGCGTSTSTSDSSTSDSSETTKSDVADNSSEVSDSSNDFKVGVVYIGDENEGYTEAHMKGIDSMQEALGLSDEQIIEKTNIPENETCYDAIVDLAEQGCDIIFTTSFGHEDYTIQAASEYPDIQFAHATGYQAAASGLDNICNYFTDVYEARYVAGVVAGLKLNEMIADGIITEDECKIGYIGAYPYAEVVSGYTAFFLGVRSVCETATMEVQYTNSWADMTLEKETAEALIADGCVLISQHADTTGGATACEANGVPIVGYNVDMTSVAPNTALTSAANNWGVYYTYAVKTVMEGGKLPADWSEGFAEGAVSITELNENIVPEGTAEKVAEVEEAIKSGELHVFDTSTFTINGSSIEDLMETDENYAKYKEYVFDGYFHESELKSAPSFDLRIDGITELTTD
ncbi:BMP family ABC transporter substrate-binding protein [Defluviitalea phaphyphila]|uniref:BMP family ABC transporter substrate-binding protein n=1 Tax=Defluviitalea phaphyphila TaxID=1473580 RepID=UPI00073190A6|nr:BMP family ABC transporter substrate-binding protein [Defluviitalea phaphyphila]